MTREYVVKVNGVYFTGIGATYEEAKADANRQALLYFWGQKPLK